MSSLLPKTPGALENLIGGEHRRGGGPPSERRSPHDGALLWRFPDSTPETVRSAVEAARSAARGWGSGTAAPSRGEVLTALVESMVAHEAELASIISAETGKAPGEALGEIRGAVTLGRFFAGEGLRLFGRTMPSAVAGKRAMTVREPIGVAALIAASNTPIANIAWKLFPALISGNTVVVKAAESTPGTAAAMGLLCTEAGVPAGVVNVIHGQRDTGRALVADEDVDVVSFTGSSVAGREIAEVCARRLARVSLELGGKNAFVVLDDADIERAVDWAVRSAFSNAGQRCSSGSRLIVTDGAYGKFLEAFVARTAMLRVGPTDADDLGPVITATARDRIVAEIERAVADGNRLLIGGERLTGELHANGNYIAPTILEMVDARHPLSNTEIFGPVAELYRARDEEQALELVNDSDYGLTAAVHTRDYGRAMRFVERASVGVVAVNAGTFGSEPHMPFGGRRASGNGTREPGTESLDVYTSLKTIYLWPDESAG